MARSYESGASPSLSERSETGHITSVAVVVPAYNAARFVGETIASVRAQTFRNVTVVAVDNGSTDETEKSTAGADIAFRLEPNRGPAAARMAGLAAVADWDAVVFLDADDRLHPDAVGTLVAALEQTPNSPVAYGNARYINAHGTPIREGELERTTAARPRIQRGRLVWGRTSHVTTFHSIAAWSPAMTPGMALIRRESFERVGGWDGAVGHASDWDLWIRLARLGDFVFVDNVVLDYRIHGENMSLDIQRLRSSEMAVAQKALACSDNTSGHVAALIDAERARIVYDKQLKYNDAISSLRHGHIGRSVMQFQRAVRISLALKIN